MSPSAEHQHIEQMPLQQIAERCAEESERFFQRQDSDPRFCYELLRRAILDRSSLAWNLFYNQYRSLVSSWILRHPAFGSSGEEVQFFVNSAYEKFWSAMSGEKFAQFPDLKSLLRYLQMCVHSVIVDQVRQADQASLSLMPELAAHSKSDANPARTSVERVAKEEFWRWLTTRLNNDKERRVVYGSFFQALKPRELFEEYRDSFRDVGEVHRVKENVLARLRRDPELRKYFGQDE